MLNDKQCRSRSVGFFMKKPTDLGLHSLLRQSMSCSAREGLIHKRRQPLQTETCFILYLNPFQTIRTALKGMNLLPGNIFFSLKEKIRWEVGWVHVFHVIDIAFVAKFSVFECRLLQPCHCVLSLFLPHPVFFWYLGKNGASWKWRLHGNFIYIFGNLYQVPRKSFVPYFYPFLNISIPIFLYNLHCLLLLL